MAALTTTVTVVLYTGTDISLATPQYTVAIPHHFTHIHIECSTVSVVTWVKLNPDRSLTSCYRGKLVY